MNGAVGIRPQAGLRQTGRLGRLLVHLHPGSIPPGEVTADRNW